MWLPLPIHALFPIGLFVVAVSSTETCNPKSCSKENGSEKAICGSDGLTYPNRCIFERARCLNKNMTLVRRGACRTQKLCSEWETSVATDGTYNFKAKCRPEGSYDSAQCIPEIGFCWCVTPEGVPLPYTVMKRKPEAKPKCGGKRKSNHRRSPSRKSRGRLCKPRDKAAFNNNLLDTFQMDFTFTAHKDSRNTNDSFVVQWKFSTLDSNHDGFLDKIEYKDLKRIAKKAVKPKRCAKTFTRSCDVNSDQRISRQEWADCLTRDGMDDGRGQNTTSDPGDGGDNDSDYEFPLAPHRSDPPEKVLIPSVMPIDKSYDDETSDLREDDPTDCLTDRHTALHEENVLYVPDCTPDGRYQKIQCYKQAGYCWCVHEDTGKNIPGTSVKNGTPSCDQLTPVSRPMKGCPDEKKFIFLRDLVHFLNTKMTQTINGTSAFNGLDYISSKEERIAKWSFVVLDKNKNKNLDRNEWKAFKEMVGTIKGLRKCGKKLPRYCDINKDRQISLTEWLDCLNVQQGTTLSTTNSAQSGKNTLNMLMED